jgi:hypothetical protein
MMRTEFARLEALVAVDARPCAPMHGYAWRQPKQGFDAISGTGDTTNAARRLLGAPT